MKREFLSNLRFADDIFLCTETPQELQQMLQELSDESRRMGLKMNIAKTMVMVVHCEKNEMVLGRAYQPRSKTTDGPRVPPHGDHNYYDRKRRQGIPAKRWRDDLDKY